MIQCHGFPTVMHKRDHWCCIILAPLICYENVTIKVAMSTITIPNIHFAHSIIPTELKQTRIGT